MAEPDVYREQQFNGFREVWNERPDGKFHGPYTVYRDRGPVVCLRGQYVIGAQEGIWTYWDRTGKFDKQIRFHRDELIEILTAPPWFDDPPATQNPIDVGAP